MAYEQIKTELTADNVGIITLARPDSLNALTAQLLDETRDAVTTLPEQGARALLLTGEGRGFSSGADLGGGGSAGMPDDLGAALENHFNPLIEAVANAPVPIVSAVNGPAAGAGASLALMADIVIAARSAYFLQAFVNIGLIPDAGATWVLPRLAGRARAMEMMMLGERIPAEKALEWGMIARVVEDEQLAEQGRALAARLAAGPTLALGMIRRLARDSQHASLADALGAERIAQRDAGRTDDFKNAVMAFLMKKPASFSGR